MTAPVSDHSANNRPKISQEALKTSDDVQATRHHQSHRIRQLLLSRVVNLPLNGRFLSCKRGLHQCCLSESVG